MVYGLCESKNGIGGRGETGAGWGGAGGGKGAPTDGSGGALLVGDVLACLRQEHGCSIGGVWCCGGRQGGGRKRALPALLETAFPMRRAPHAEARCGWRCHRAGVEPTSAAVRPAGRQRRQQPRRAGSGGTRGGAARPPPSHRRGVDLPPCCAFPILDTPDPSPPPLPRTEASSPPSRPFQTRRRLPAVAPRRRPRPQPHHHQSLPPSPPQRLHPPPWSWCLAPQ